MTKQYLPLGEVVGAHGLRGELRVKPLCDGAEFAKQFKVLFLSNSGTNAVRLLRVREHKNVLLFVLDGVESIGQAEAMRGRKLWFCRADAELAEGAVFIVELLGCTAVDADTGAVYGTIADVTSMPANDVWHINTPDGGEALFPAVAEMIAEIDTMSGIARLRPIAGIFDNN
ncbi:MAG: ribosome maturation factor RimM [Oscillospiraceae bacterium]|nr:ribosome maturation factor RimM [Oscillospiraceae bacterium]